MPSIEEALGAASGMNIDEIERETNSANGRRKSGVLNVISSCIEPERSMQILGFIGRIVDDYRKVNDNISDVNLYNMQLGIFDLYNAIAKSDTHPTVEDKDKLVKVLHEILKSADSWLKSDIPATEEASKLCSSFLLVMCLAKNDATSLIGHEYKTLTGIRKYDVETEQYDFKDGKEFKYGFKAVIETIPSLIEELKQKLTSFAETKTETETVASEASGSGTPDIEDWRHRMDDLRSGDGTEEDPSPKPPR